MGGGLIQLVIKGPEDIFFIGNPQISFFKIMYKKYTNFSKKTINLNLKKIQNNDGTSVSIGDKISYTIEKIGDLVQEMYLNITTTMKEVIPSNILTYRLYDKYDITNIIEYVEIEIGGHKIDKHYSQWLDIYNELFEIKHEYRFSLNKFEIRTLLDYIYEVDSSTNLLMSPATSPSIDNFKSKDFNISMTTTPISTTIDTYEFNIKFIHTTITLDNTLKTQLDDLIKKIFKEHNLQITINGTSSIDSSNIYKIKIKSIDIYSVIDLMEKLSNNPHTKERNYIIPLKFWFNKNAGLALPLIALQYHKIKLYVKFTDSINTKWGNCIIDNNTFYSSLLVNYIYLDTNEKKKFIENKHEYLIEQIQYTGPEILNINTGINKTYKINFNYPIKGLFWTTNEGYLENIELQLNEHSRFNSENGDYFHIIQPYETKLNKHGKTLYKNRIWKNKDNVDFNNRTGMYSFSLNPYEYQPNGLCNFSNINNGKLNFKLKYNTTLYLFGLNYNILRINQGTCGLVY